MITLEHLLYLATQKSHPWDSMSIWWECKNREK